jgi:hypothetical protein
MDTEETTVIARLRSPKFGTRCKGFEAAIHWLVQKLLYGRPTIVEEQMAPLEVSAKPTIADGRVSITGC